MKINKVMLRNRGIKGLDLVYEKYEERGGVSFLVEVRDKRRAPVHGDLLKCFEWLEKSMLLVLEKERGNVEVNGVEIKDVGYVLHGSLEVGSGVIGIKSGILSGENFDGYGEVLNIVKGLLEEVGEYLDRGKTMGIDEYLAVLDKGKVEYEGLSEEEKKAVSIKLLEEAGAIVLMPSEVSLGVDEDLGVGVNSEDKEEEKDGLEEIDFFLPVINEKVLVKKKLDSDDFEL